MGGELKKTLVEAEKRKEKGNWSEKRGKKSEEERAVGRVCSAN